MTAARASAGSAGDGRWAPPRRGGRRDSPWPRVLLLSTVPPILVVTLEGSCDASVVAAAFRPTRSHSRSRGSWAPRCRGPAANPRRRASALARYGRHHERPRPPPLNEHERRNRQLECGCAAVGGAGPAPLVERRAVVGHVRGARGRRRHSARRRWPRCHRAGLRHRLLVGVAGAARRAADRPGPQRASAGDRGGVAARARPGLPACARQRRGRAAARRQLRPGVLRVRRGDLVRTRARLRRPTDCCGPGDA